MARLPWRRTPSDDAAKAAPSGATMVPLGDVVAALTRQQQANAAGPAEPMPRPAEWMTTPFAPGNPVNPSAINPLRPDTGRPEPRLWQFPVSWNLPSTQHRLVPWQTLRDAAETPMFRRCIEIRKTAISTLAWDITISQAAVEEAGRGDGAEGRADVERKLRQRLDGEIARLVSYWEQPDAGNGLEFTDWASMVLEELFVLDALAIYPRMTYGGDLHALEVLDGSTIKPLLTDRGGRPQPPHPAYQQILYGFPRGEFTADAADGEAAAGFTPDQLIYRRKVRRTWTPYGLSPTEQALIDGDLYLRRLGWMRNEYTDGTMPAQFMTNDGANQWTARQLLEYERDFNDRFSGNSAERLRFPFLPPGLQPAQQDQVPERYKPDYDLHLIKLVAMHFDVTLPELGFSEAKGLGSSGWSEGQESVQYRTATLPTARWLETLLTKISRAHLGMPAELEFRFLGLDDEDEQAADGIAAARTSTGRMTLNEDRDRMGMPRYAFAEADMPYLATARGVVFLDGASEAAQPGQMVVPGAPAPDTPPGSGAGQGDETSPGPGEGGDGQEGGEQADVAKAELAAFRRWARKHPTGKRPFTFTAGHDVLLALAPDLADDDRVTFKASDADPKGPDWPGWEQDQRLAAIYTRRLREAFADLDADRIASSWLAARTSTKTAEPADAGATQDARAWAETAGVYQRLVAIIRSVLGDAWLEGWLLGHISALARLNGRPPDWAGWTPGNPAAARKLIGGAQGLQSLLGHYGVTAINSIASTRLDELAALLAQALRDGWGPEGLAREIRDLFDDADAAHMVATTEIARAQSQASMDSYQQSGVDRVEWLVAPTDACPICTGNAAEGPVRRGQDFAGGVDSPPQHPRCRCAIAPAID